MNSLVPYFATSLGCLILGLYFMRKVNGYITGHGIVFAVSISAIPFVNIAVLLVGILCLYDGVFTKPIFKKSNDSQGAKHEGNE